MSEYEWEVRRVPRSPDPRGMWIHRPRRSPVAEFVALEFPRESVASVVRVEPMLSPKVGASEGSNVPKPVQRTLSEA